MTKNGRRVKKIVEPEPPVAPKITDFPVDWHCENCKIKGKFLVDAEVDPSAMFEVAMGMHNVYMKYKLIQKGKLPCKLKQGASMAPRLDSSEGAAMKYLGFTITLR